MAQSLTRLDKEKYWKPFCQTLDQRRMKMRARRLLKSTNVIVVLLMLIGSFMNPAPIVLADASGSVDSGLTPSSTEIAVGDTITVEVYIDVTNVVPDDNILGGYNAELTWDAGILEYQGYSGVPTGGNFDINQSNVDIGEISFGGINSSGWTGKIILVILEFQALSAGSANFSLDFTSMSAPSPSWANLLLIANDPVIDQVQVIDLIPGQVVLDESPVFAVMQSGTSIDVLNVIIGDGTDRLLLVGVSYNFSQDSPLPSIGSVNFIPTNPSGDPISLDYVIDQFSPDETGDTGRNASIYMLDPAKNPVAGTVGTISVSFIADEGGDDDYTTGTIVGVVQFEGVNQANPLGDSSGAAIGNSSGQSVTASVSTTGSELVFDTVWTGGQPTWTMTPGVDESDISQTELWNNGYQNTLGGASIKVASEGSTSMTWRRSNAGYMALVAVVINPVMIEPPTCFPLSLSSSLNGGDPIASPENSYGCPVGQYEEGELISLTADPDEGYQVASWSGTNNDLSVDLTNALTMSAGPASVHVVYQLEPASCSGVELDGAVSSATFATTTIIETDETVSLGFTTGEGDNRLLLVGISWNPNTAPETISSVTFTPNNEAPISLDEKIQQKFTSSNRYAAIFSLVNPPAEASGTIKIVFSGNVSAGIVVGAANFTGVDPTTPLDAAKGASGKSVNFDSLDGDELVFDTLFLGGNPPASVTPDEGRDPLWDQYVGNTRGAASIKQATSSSLTMSWTSTGTTAAIAAIPINPAPCTNTCYTLTLGIESGNGSLPTAVPVKSAACSEAGQYVAGETIYLSATPDPGWLIESWTGTDASDSNIVTMPDADRTANVIYSAACYSLTLSHTGAGSDPTAAPTQSEGCAAGSYHEGESITLSAVPADGWEIGTWEGTDGGSDSHLTMPGENHSASVNYVSTLSEIMLDGAVSSTSQDGGSTVTLTHTIGTGVGRLLMVGVSANSYNGEQTISNITFTPNGGGALQLTKVGDVENEAGRLSAIYSLIDPPSGATGTITVTFSGSVGYGIIVGAANFENVDLLDPFDEFASAVGTESSGLNVPVVTDPGDMVFDNLFMGAADPPTLSAGAGQTSLWNHELNRATGVSSYKEAVSSSTTMSWSISGGSTSYYWAIGAVPINPMPVSDIYELTMAVDPSGGGTTSPIEGLTHSYIAGTEAEISATANSGYIFDHWGGTDGADVSDPNSATTTITMDGDKSITAYFTTMTVPITFTGEELLGRPTDSSISIKIVPDEAIDFYFEYREDGESYPGTTKVSGSATAGEPVTTVLTELTADTEYFYRLVYSTDGGSTWVTRDELSFHTQRAEGSTFTFDITTDSHVNILLGNSTTWTNTLNDIANDDADFLIDLGDTFAMDDVAVGENSEAEAAYLFQLPYFNMISGETAIFLAPGNHEQQEAWHLNNTEYSISVLGTNAQKKYFLNPIPDGDFYTGDEDQYPYLSEFDDPVDSTVGGFKQDYYSWEWGDALFVVINPYWYTEQKPYVNDPGGGESDTTGTGDAWDWTLGSEQFNWLKDTLANSDATYKFIFSHQMVSDASLGGQEDYGHAGAEEANLVEWGGYNEDGTTYGWDDNRDPAQWGNDPVHEILKANGVNAFFHGHDHQYAHQERDEVIYQTVPSAGFTGNGFSMYSESDPYTIKVLDNGGHLKVVVSSEQTCVYYIKTGQTTPADSYCFEPIPPNEAPVVTDIPDQTVAEGENFATISLDDYVSDPDNTDAEMSWTYADDGDSELTVTITDRVATITIPNLDWNGSELITFTAEDPEGASDSDSATFTVSAVNDPPVVDGIPDQYVDEGGTFTAITLDDYVSDVDNTDAEMSWTYSGNSQLTVTITDRVATIGIPSLSWTGQETITFTATDPGSASDSDSATFTVGEINHRPVLHDIGNWSVNEEVLLTFTATADDEDEGQDLTFSLDVGPSVSVPDGAVITEEGVFTWTPTEAQGPGIYTFDVCVSDGALEDCETITVTVNEVNVKPNLDPIGTKDVNELVALSFSASAIDADVPEQTLTFSLDSGAEGMVPVGAVITAGGAFTWTPTETQGPNVYTFDVCVNDGVLYDCDTITVTVHEVNEAPEIDAIESKSVDEGSLLTFTANADDPDLPAQALEFSLVGAPTGAAIDSLTGVFSWTPTEAQGPNVYTFAVCVSDGALDDCTTITVTVNEVNVAPVLGAIGNKSVDEGSLLTFTATAIDSDLPAQDLEFSLVGAPTGAAIDSLTGVFSWTPTEAQGPDDYTFDICVSDGALDDCETITISVSEFVPKACYVLTFSHTGDGSDPTPNIANSTGCEPGTYESGETINLSGAVPAGGWYIVSWYGTEDDSSTGDTNVVVMPEGDTEVGVDYETSVYIPLLLGPNN